MKKILSLLFILAAAGNSFAAKSPAENIIKDENALDECCGQKVTLSIWYHDYLLTGTGEAEVCIKSNTQNNAYNLEKACDDAFNIATAEAKRSLDAQIAELSEE